MSQLARTARVLTVGSCFADSIGVRLVANKVETRVNPFGTVFQPLALARLLRAAAGEEVDWQQHLVQARGRWQSYDLHGSIGADSPVELLQHIQQLMRETGEFLHQADVVMLTLGTAWAYRLRETGELVSNCHKQPADLFVRELLTPDEIINALAETHAYLRRLNPSLRFVLTVSPVRHLKDTLQLNSVSKSVLRVATHIASDLLPDVAYFPAYELLVDDLRDYRFYGADMLHPSAVAEEYVWDKFARAYFDTDFGRFRQDWAAVRQSLGHRPLHTGAPEHRQFLESTREKLEQLSLRQVDVAAELREVRTALAALPVPQPPEPAAEVEDGEERIDIGTHLVVSEVKRVSDPSLSVADAADATLAAALGQPARGEERPLRLSPEEFRAQRAARPERGRRDGRGKSQRPQPTENELFQAASFAAADEFAPQPFLPAEELAEVQPVASAPEATPGTPTVERDGVVGVVEEPGRKKNRRSRGGAKRTARKHALRAAEIGLEEGQLPASGAALEAAAGTLSEGETLRPQKSSVITKSQPVKRGGRRNEPRVPREELFAAPAPVGELMPGSSQETALPNAPADREQPVVTLDTLDGPATEQRSGDASADAGDPPKLSRNSRNRKKKKAAKEAAKGSVGTSAAGASTFPTATIGQLSEAPTPAPVAGALSNIEPRLPSLPVAALPVPETAAATAAAAVAPAAKPAKANSSRRTKSRAMSGIRAEKPAIDTPIIPASDPSNLPTQVAAGRMTGTTAKLIEPTASEKSSLTKAAPKATGAAQAASTAKPLKAAAKTTDLPAPVATPAMLAAAPAEPAASKMKAKAATNPKTVAKAKPAATVATAEPIAPKVPTDALQTTAETTGKATPKSSANKATEPAGEAEKPAKPAAKAKTASKTGRAQGPATKPAAKVAVPKIPKAPSAPKATATPKTTKKPAV